MSCVFCEIVRGMAPASIIYRDATVMAFMAIRPIAPGQCLVIPTAHVDHFTDLDDDVAREIIVLAQRIGRQLRDRFSPSRVGMVVHGYGVAHAHLMLIPQHAPDDITSGRFARIENGQIVYSEDVLPVADRAVLDGHARQLAEQEPVMSPDPGSRRTHVDIHLALPEELAAIAALDPAGWQSAPRRKQVESAIMAGECWLAGPGGAPLGLVIMQYSFYGRGFVPLLIVRGNARRQGIGLALLEHVASECRTSKLFTSTNDSNTAMGALLVRAGFERSGVIHNLDPDDPELVFVRQVESASRNRHSKRSM